MEGVEHLLSFMLRGRHQQLAMACVQQGQRRTVLTIASMARDVGVLNAASVCVRSVSSVIQMKSNLSVALPLLPAAFAPCVNATYVSPGSGLVPTNRDINCCKQPLLHAVRTALCRRVAWSSLKLEAMKAGYSPLLPSARHALNRHSPLCRTKRSTRHSIPCISTRAAFPWAQVRSRAAAARVWLPSIRPRQCGLHEDQYTALLIGAISWMNGPTLLKVVTHGAYS